MNIAMIGYAHPFGENGYYGAERVIWYLMQQYKSMGHRVVLFSVEGCSVPGFEYVSFALPWLENRDQYADAIVAFENEQQVRFDVVHSFMASGYIDNAFRLSRPWCLEPFFGFTRFTDNRIAYSDKLNSINGNVSTRIYYGIPENQYRFDSDHDGYLVWIGRIDIGKAPHIAIDVARRAGRRLILMGPAYHYPYFAEKIWPHIDNDRVIWLRAVNDRIKARVFRRAMAFLSTNATGYHEMFGIVNIESLACGVPVIGWGDRNAQSAINFNGHGEIIDHGVHGFINEYSGDEGIDSAVDAVHRISDGQIDRHACRQRFEQRFTSKISAEKHILYYNMLKAGENIGNQTSTIEGMYDSRRTAQGV